MSESRKLPAAKNEFESLRDAPQCSLTKEFYLFVTEHKKWWLIPILLVFGLVSAVLILGSTGAAPFIYTLF